MRRAIARFPDARHFLTALQLGEPDVVAEVLESILPRYAGLDAAQLDAAQHESDLERVARALADAPPAGRARLAEKLQETAFLVGENAADGAESADASGRSLYQRTPDLEIYFGGNPDIWFARDGYGPWLAQLREMGVRDAVAVHARTPDGHGHVAIVEDFARHERGLHGFDPDAVIEGLEWALSHPGHRRSEYVWNQLLEAQPATAGRGRRALGPAGVRRCGPRGPDVGGRRRGGRGGLASRPGRGGPPPG